MISKFNPLSWFLSFLFLSLAVLAVGFLMFWRPNMQEVKMNNEVRDQLNSEIAKEPQVNRRLREANALRAEADAQWQNIVEQKTPEIGVPNGGIDLSVNRWQLTADARQFRNEMQRDLNRQMKRGGVKLIAAPVIPAFSNNAADIVETGFNFPDYGFPVVIHDLGQVTVEGTYNQIMDHVKSWSDMPNYLAVADGLQLAGTSPRLRGTYNLSIVALIRGNRVAPPVPQGAADGAAGASTTGAPGGPGGPPSGFGRPGGAPGGEEREGR